MSQDLASKSVEITFVPISDLVVPPWNPREIMFEDDMRILTAFLEKGGRVDRILVWKGNGLPPWAIISGQRRLEAFRRLGRDQVEVEILDISLEDAGDLARSSNQGVKPHWLDDYESWDTYIWRSTLI